jgi:hypothetical protein
MNSLTGDQIHPVAVGALSGIDLQAHFRVQSPAQESANTMPLPAGSTHNLVQSRAFALLKQSDCNGFLTAIPQDRCLSASLAALRWRCLNLRSVFPFRTLPNGSG